MKRTALAAVLLTAGQLVLSGCGDAAPSNSSNAYKPTNTSNVGPANANMNSAANQDINPPTSSGPSREVQRQRNSAANALLENSNTNR